MRRWLRRLLRRFRPRPERWTGSGRELQPITRDLLQDFKTACRDLAAPRVLELGTRPYPGSAAPLRRDWVPHAREYHGSDREAGPQVDVVADVHRLSEVTGPERYEVVIACSVLEHYRYPQLAAHEVMKVMTVGGLLFLQTHQTFPLHAFPHDYHRFSEQALRALFPVSMGCVIEATDYEFPCEISSARQPGMEDHPAFLNVRIFARKAAATPATFQHEF